MVHDTVRSDPVAALSTTVVAPLAIFRPTFAGMRKVKVAVRAPAAVFWKRRPPPETGVVASSASSMTLPLPTANQASGAVTVPQVSFVWS